MLEWCKRQNLRYIDNNSNYYINAISLYECRHTDLTAVILHIHHKLLRSHKFRF